MLLLYFKQAWNLLRQEKLFSSIYVVGTGLSITIVMVLSIVYYIKIANIYPEMNRDRTLIVKSAMEKYKNGGTGSSAISRKFIDECLRPQEGIEVLSVTVRDWEEHYMQYTNSKEQTQVILKYVDVPFWEVFSFRFIEGKPFTEADFESAIATAVVSESTAKKLFGRTDVVGEYASIDFRQYRICGVVRDASYVTSRTYANFWIPCTLQPDYDRSFGNSGYLGSLEAVILASSLEDIDKIKQNTRNWVERFNRADEEVEFSLVGQPDQHWESTFRFWSNVGPDFKKIAWQYSLIFLVLLLVPAISLSGMTDSRMERRLAEMGVRRAFGAPVDNLMGQVISENLLFTLLGGLAGLFFSYILILLSADWIMTIGSNFVDLPPEGTKVLFTPGMLLNLPVFFVALSVCFVLNLLTAVIPAWRASHKDIVYSLNAKQ
ncbi:ABC transporter permease [Parabacteroides sp. PF5-6]|uniref:ABC transporter permease n=1 Tax=Parabacteroides sp. PF5-6 TaxID=1742403 RepID=UPI002405DC04|nr:ABC transporter permease [Parabacteroides sp. PF5-6]MDF9829408.1 putative ABC transport system permease protein [Parabacteroides sp. PF5-6]